MSSHQTKNLAISRNYDEVTLNYFFIFFLGEVGVVAGWGRLSEGGKLPNILQYVSISIISSVIRFRFAKKTISKYHTCKYTFEM
jgi:hypothetical protein